MEKSHNKGWRELETRGLRIKNKKRRIREDYRMKNRRNRIEEEDWRIENRIKSIKK